MDFISERIKPDQDGKVRPLSSIVEEVNVCFVAFFIDSSVVLCCYFNSCLFLQTAVGPLFGTRHVWRRDRLRQHDLRHRHIQATPHSVGRHEEEEAPGRSGRDRGGGEREWQQKDKKRIEEERRHPRGSNWSHATADTPETHSVQKWNLYLTKANSPRSRRHKNCMFSKMSRTKIIRIVFLCCSWWVLTTHPSDVSFDWSGWSKVRLFLVLEYKMRQDCHSLLC